MDQHLLGANLSPAPEGLMAGWGAGVLVLVLVLVVAVAESCSWVSHS